MQLLLPIHIAAGGLAIVLGAVALVVKKGGTIHRRSGLLFVYAMLVMSFSASILALRNGLPDGNLAVGLMTAYFVGTALTTVRPVSPWTRRINAAALTVVVGLALVSIVGGVKAFNSPRGFQNGVPFLMFFFIATVSERRTFPHKRRIATVEPLNGATDHTHRPEDAEAVYF